MKPMAASWAISLEFGNFRKKRNVVAHGMIMDLGETYSRKKPSVDNLLTLAP